MNCHQLDTILDDHAAGSLSAAQRSEVDDHLATCARCSDAWLGYRALAADSAGGLVVKTLACCARGPVFNPWVHKPKFSTDLYQQNPSCMSG